MHLAYRGEKLMMFLLISSDINWLWESYFILSFPPYHVFSTRFSTCKWVHIVLGFFFTKSRWMWWKWLKTKNTEPSSLTWTHSKVLRILLMILSGKETGLFLGRMIQMISKGEQVTHALSCLLAAGGWINIYDDSKFRIRCQFLLTIIIFF